MKLARHETGRQNVITFKGGFHGRSLATLAMTSSKTAYGVGYGPLPSGIFHTDFPYCSHCSCKPASGPACCGSATRSLRALFNESTAPRDTAAIVIEPILGEGGYVLPPPGFLKEIRAICDEHGIMMVADEVQSGVGRTGKFWAVQHEGVTPDILIFAKGIASGMPLSGIAARGNMMKKSPPSSMGGTYGANAVSAAAAVATIEAIQQDGMLENATARGDQLLSALHKLQSKYPQLVHDVRGRGCMVGLEFKPSAGYGFAGAVTAAAMEDNVLLLTAVSAGRGGGGDMQGRGQANLPRAHALLIHSPLPLSCLPLPSCSPLLSIPPVPSLCPLAELEGVHPLHPPSGHHQG